MLQPEGNEWEHQEPFKTQLCTAKNAKKMNCNQKYCPPHSTCTIHPYFLLFCFNILAITAQSHFPGLIMSFNEPYLNMCLQFISESNNVAYKVMSFFKTFLKRRINDRRVASCPIKLYVFSFRVICVTSCIIVAPRSWNDFSKIFIEFCSTVLMKHPFNKNANFHFQSICVIYTIGSNKLQKE